MRKTYDIAILGSGPGGYVAAIRAAELGLSVCLIEKEKLGGVCLHAGCIPTKFLLKNVHLLYQLKKMQNSGIRIEKIDIDFKLMQEKKQNIVNQLQKGIEYLLKKHAVDIVTGYGTLASENNIEVEGKKIDFKNCIIAVGSHSVDLPQIKADRVKGILFSQEIMELKEIPKSLLIIGGGAIGCEFADIFNGLGSEVKIIELAEHILPTEDPDIAQILAGDFKKRGIQVFAGVKVSSVRDYEKNGFEAVLETGERLSTEKILLAVGRAPNSETSNIKELGIKLDQGKIIVDNSLRTNIKNIYAIGDVVGKTYFAHTASREGIVAVENIAGLPVELNYDLVPRCVYAYPEIASVGLNEIMAKKQGIKIKVGKFPLTANARARVEGENQGLAKFIVDEKSNKILGASLSMVYASEIIHEICVAISAGMKVQDFIKIIHAHPTISESVMESAEMIEAKAIHIV